MDFEFGKIEYDATHNICKVVLTSPTPLFEQLLSYVYDTCNELANNKPYLLMTVFDTEVQPTKEAYSFYSSKERTNHIIKECFVIKSSGIKLAANFYFRVMKPHVLGKAFDNETDAFEWIIKP